MLIYIDNFFNLLKKAILLLLIFGSFSPLFAQNLTCHTNVVVDLGGACDSVLHYSIFLESTNSPQDSFHLEINGNSNNSDDEVTVGQINESLFIYVTHVPSGNMCWGFLDVVNTAPPELLCEDVSVFCHEPTDTSVIGAPDIVNPCYSLSAYDISYTEQMINLDCDDDYAFIINRLWTVTDPNGLTTTCSQDINGEWLSFSAITFPEHFDDEVNPAFHCNDSISFAMLTDTSVTGVPLAYGRRITGNFCEMAISYSDVLIPICGLSREIKRNWTVTNLCTNATNSSQQIIQYKDIYAPDFFVPDTLRATTSDQCSSNFELPPADVNFECSGYEIEIETPWETLNTNGGIIDFPLQAADYTITYTLTDDCGNVATKPVVFKVRDTETLLCPSDTTITCKRFFDFYANPINNGNFSILANLGRPEIDGNCYFLFERDAIVTVDDCGMGTILHLMYTSDSSTPMQCEQTITVEHVSDFSVEFPASTTITCDAGPDSYGMPIIYGDNCEQIEIAYEDEILNDVPGACYRIVRNWKVFNTCISNADTTNIVVETSEIDLGLLDDACDLNDDGNCNNLTFKDGLTAANYPNAQPDGVIEFTQIIDVVDNTPPDFINGCDIPTVCVQPNNCVATITLPMPELSVCDYRDHIQVSSALGQGVGPFANISVGSILVNYLVTDDCGHSSSCTGVLLIEDCTPPNAICYPQILLQLNEGNNCTGVVNAFDISNGTTDNCLGNLEFSFSADSLHTQMTFTEADAASHPVMMFVTDESGNQSSCSSLITIETDETCMPPEGEPISGFITTSAGNGIADVEIDISINNNTITTAISDISGLYEGSVIFLSDNYLITPTKEDSNPVMDVTTFDLVILRRHILGDVPITDPYKLIAADVNGSNSITTLDLVNIRRLILGTIPSFPVPTWRFIPMDYTFPDPTNPWMPPFPESIQLNTVPPVLDADFIGVKMGNLN